MSLRDHPKSVVTIGTFDGVHLGHRALFAAASRLASERELKRIAYTFEKPPQNYFGNPKKLLMPFTKKIELLRHFVDAVEVAHFPEVRSFTAEQFVINVLMGRLRMAALVVGEDFRFGKERQGSPSLLKEMGSEYKFDVAVVGPVMMAGHAVSSTAIREALSEGDVERANGFLGEPARLWGRVVRGQGQASELGFPTANLELDPDVLVPASGIYAAQARCSDGDRPAALYIGSRPTFDGAKISIEAHLLDQNHLDLYGQELELSLYSRIRGDQRFETVAELQDQIKADVDAVRGCFKV